MWDIFIVVMFVFHSTFQCGSICSQLVLLITNLSSTFGVCQQWRLVLQSVTGSCCCL